MIKSYNFQTQSKLEISTDDKELKISPRKLVIIFPVII